MANDYFDSFTQFVRGTLARAEQVNSTFNTVIAGFDKLPGEDELNQGRHMYVVDSGAANAYVVTLAKVPSSYEDGLTFTVKISATNTSTATINVNSLGVKQVRTVEGSPLTAGDLEVGGFYTMVYDSDSGYFRLLTPHYTATGVTAAALTSAIAAHAAESDPHTGYVLEASTDASSYGFVLDEDNLSSDDATKVPTQQSVKAYVDNAVSGGVTYQGGYNAATNTPDLDTAPSGVTQGDMYTVTAAGTFFTTSVDIGDVLIAEADSATTEAEWTIVEKNLDNALVDADFSSNGIMTRTAAGTYSNITIADAGSGSVVVVNGNGSGNITLDVDESTLDHDTLSGFVANEHIDWTSATSSFSTSGTAATGALTVTGNIIVTGTVDGVDVAALQTDVDGFPDALKNLTTAEIGELENIGTTTISAAQWGYLGSSNQGIATTDNVVFNNVTIGASGRLVTGGESAPDCDAGGITINHGANDGWALSVKNSDTSHAMTGLAEADTYAGLYKISATLGGLGIAGLSETGAAGIRLDAYRGVAVSGDTAEGCINLDGRESDGATGTQAIGNDDNIVAFRNVTTTVGVVKGNGDTTIQGDFTAVDGIFSGSLVVGDSATGVSYTSVDALVIGSASGNEGIVIDASPTTSGYLTVGDGTAITGRIEYNNTSDYWYFLVNASTPACRMESSGQVAFPNSINITDGLGNDRSLIDFDTDLIIRNKSSSSILLGTNNTDRVRIDTDGKVSTGGESAPDVDAGGLCLQQASGTGNLFTMKSSGMPGHPFTTQSEADTYAEFKKVDNTQGGLMIETFARSNDAPSFEIQAHWQTPRTGDGETAAITLETFKSDGGTSTAALGASDNMFAILNSGVKFMMKGDGDAIFAKDIIVGDDIIASQTSGEGIKVGTHSTSAFGYRDITGQIVTKGAGANNPSWSTITGNFSAFDFSIGDECWLNFHIPHDYVPSTDIYLHTHWTTGGAQTNTVKWQFEYAFAKGMNQAAFNFTTSTTITVEEAASGTAYQHMVTESTAQTISALTEPDGLLMVHLSRITNGGTDNTNSVYLLMADVHYQSTNLGTIDKAPNFYT